MNNSADWLDAPRTFIRVYRLPSKLTNGYCFGGGVPIAFTNVDWFEAAISDGRDVLADFVRNKRYYDKTARFLVLADEPALTFTIEPETPRANAPAPDATPAQQAEPVWDAYRDDWVHEDDPAPAPDATPAQQEEWRLVPVKPHIDMIEAALDLKHEDGAPHEIVMCDCWSAMVAAAPRQDAATPAQQVSAAGPEPVEWRCRMHSDAPGYWARFNTEIFTGYDIVEPLYTTPVPALAPQHGLPDPRVPKRIWLLLHEGEQASHVWCDDPDPSGTGDVDAVAYVQVGVAQPDLLPGLKRALKLCLRDGFINSYTIRAEIARIEKERQS